MKSFFRKIIIIFSLFIGIPILILIIMFNTDTKNSTDYLKAYSDKKNELIKIKDKKKIIFIGGSNVAFGLNSEEIKNNFFEYEILNYGLHAGIGIKYLLNEIDEYLKEENVLIIIPEYENFYNEGLGEEALWEIVGIQKSLDSLDRNYLKKITKLFLGFKNYIYINSINNDYGKKFTYDRRGFNKYGDYVEHWKFEKRSSITPSIMQNKKLSITFIEEFKDRIEKIEAKGTKVYLLPPVYQNSSYQINKDKILLILKQLDRFNIKIERFIYSDELFFDTVYHLNKEGVDKRTEEIIQFLKRNIPQK